MPTADPRPQGADEPDARIGPWPAGRPLRVVVATPLRPDLCERIAAVDPRVQVIVEHDLLPAMRFPSDHLGEPGFRRTPEQQARFEQLVDSADVLYGIPGVDPVQLARVVRANPRLAWVQAMFAGAGATVVAAGLSEAELARVRVTTSAGVHGLPLSEWALLGIFCGARRLPHLLADQRDHRWGPRFAALPVAGSTVLILGLGGIGCECARLCAALGMRVLGVSRRGEAVEGVSTYAVGDLADIIGEADHIVVTLPGTRHTEGLLDAAMLARAKPGVTVVNVGRGAVIDEAALIEALRSGQVGFAALDVTAVEPLSADSPLWDLPNVVLSPHTAALDHREEDRIAELFCANLRAFLAGEPLVNVVDPAHGY